MVTLPDKLAFVDIETTGTSATRDRIIEVAVLRIEKNVLVNTFQSLVNPQSYVSPYIEALTGIKKDDLVRAPLFEDISQNLEDILNECIFISHNVRFDYSFVRNEFLRLGTNFSPTKCCTVRLSRHIFPHERRHDLDSLINRMGIECKNRHRAMDDAKAIWEFYQKMAHFLPQDKFVEAFAAAVKRASFPTKVDQKTLDSLPENPGVYLFYDASDTLLYVGKSINIKERILSHFTQNDNSTDAKICKETARIETHLTAGELGALIKEAYLVKTLHPIYNRQLRRTRNLTVAVRETNEQGYDCIGFKNSETISANETDQVFGIFKSRKQAVSFLRRICKDYHLCPKLLGLEKCTSVCMHHQFGWCKGACIGKEINVSYNIRLLQAVSKTKIDRWPFNGPISIIERGEGDLIDQFFINNWCAVDSSDTQVVFDYDMYKILRKYLRRKSNLAHVNTSVKNPEPVSRM